jgi:universal stress protein A
MQDYRHILLATDFSDASEQIGQRAVSLARLFGARISLIHVVEHVPMDFPNDIVIPEQLDGVEVLVDDAHARLKQLAEQLGLPDADRWVEVGSPKSEIARIASAKQVDLIVVGSHGRHGLALLLGSSANGVLHLAPCDVLAVRIKQ